MGQKRSFRIELNPAFAAEVTSRYGDLEGAVREAIPWVITRVAVARDPDLLRCTLDELEEADAIFRALVGCELLGQASARPDVRQWLCEYVTDLNPGEGARYQLANAYSRLGADARRTGNLARAVFFARRGLDAVADLPSRAVTANLYYNLGVALQGAGDSGGAIESFEHAAEIDEMIGRPNDAAESRRRIDSLKPPRPEQRTDAPRES